MENIFIDTSIFEANNFLESKRINEILRLSEEGYIKIVLPELTYREIISRTRKNITEAVQKFKMYRNDTRVFRNINSLKGKFTPINEDECKKELEVTIEKRFKMSKVEIIGYPTIPIKEVFNSYFDKKFPFGSGIKKSEFPDAFALLSIEKWCRDNNQKCLVFSKDKNIIQFESEFLDVVEDYEKFLSDKLIEIEMKKKHEERLAQFQKLYEDNSHNLIKQIEEWVHNELDDFSRYYDYSNYMEVHDIDIKDISVDLEDYQITKITEEAISIQTKAYVNFKVEIVFDDENFAIKDDETKTWHYMDKKSELIDEILYIPVDLNYAIPQAGKEFIELEIEEINGGRNLKI